MLLSISASPVCTAAGFGKCCEKESPGAQLLLGFNFSRSWEYRRMRTPLSVKEKQAVNLLLRRHCLPTQFVLIKSSARPERSCHNEHFTVVFKHGNKDWDLYLCTLEIMCDGANQQTHVCGRNVCPWAGLGGNHNLMMLQDGHFWCWGAAMENLCKLHVLEVFPQQGRYQWQYLHLRWCHFSKSPA